VVSKTKPIHEITQNQHERKYTSLELDLAFDAKLRRGVLPPKVDNVANSFVLFRVMSWIVSRCQETKPTPRKQTKQTRTKND